MNNINYNEDDLIENFTESSRLSESVDSIASQILSEMEENESDVKPNFVIKYDYEKIPDKNTSLTNQNSKQEELQNNDSKYGDDEKFESFSDINIFFPITRILVSHQMELLI